MAIIYSGTKKFSDEDKNNLFELVNSNYWKLIKRFSNLEFTVHVDKKSVTGKRHRYIVKVKAEAPNVIGDVEREGWDLRQLLHRIFLDLKVELDHRFGKKK